MLQRGVISPETYEALVLVRAAKHGVAVTEMAMPAQVYVNCGRTVADCVCGAGMAVDPDWPGFCGCLACFRVYRTVLVPVDYPAVEAALEALPVKHQSWTVDEPIAEMRTRVKLVTRERIDLPDEEKDTVREPPIDVTPRGGGRP